MAYQHHGKRPIVMYALCKQFITLTFGVFLLLMSVIAVRAQETVYLTNGEWPPYLSEHLPHHGFASHVVTEAFKIANIDVEYGFFPWKRSYLYAKTGTPSVGVIWQGTLVWVHTVERAKDFLYSDPVLTEEVLLFSRKDSPVTWKKLEDLQGRTIGATLHTAYPQLEQAERDNIVAIVRGGKYTNLLHRLLEKRVDAVPLVSEVGRYYLRTLLAPEERGRISCCPKAIETKVYHLLLTRSDPQAPELLQRFNDGLRQLRESGRYEEMLNDLRQGKYD